LHGQGGPGQAFARLSAQLPAGQASKCLPVHQLRKTFDWAVEDSSGRNVQLIAAIDLKQSFLPMLCTKLVTIKL
jgi:hypothetical protein